MRWERRYESVSGVRNRSFVPDDREILPGCDVVPGLEVLGRADLAEIALGPLPHKALRDQVNP